MKRLSTTLITLLIITVGCSLIENDSKQGADRYTVRPATDSLTIKYKINGQTTTVVTDTTTEDYLEFNAEGEQSPLLQIINGNTHPVTINGSIYSDDSDSPLGSVGGNLEPGQSLTVTTGVFSQ